MKANDEAIAFREQLVQSYAARAEEDPLVVAVADPHRDDTPLVYVNKAFVDLTGYTKDEVLGHNCRFLQGPDTNPAALCLIRERLAAGIAVAIEILNYKKDGTPFRNALSIAPVFDIHGQVALFVGTQREVTKRRPGLA